MNSGILEFLGVILAAFIGSILSHYFTIWKFQKDVLYKKKLDAYEELVNALLDFEKYCLKTNPPTTIIITYRKLVESINKSYLFMPGKLFLYIQNIIGNPFKMFKEKTKLDHKTCEYYFSFDVTQKLESGKSEPEISSIMVDIFSSFLNEIPEIGRKLKEDIGTTKIGVHFIKN